MTQLHTDIFLFGQKTSQSFHHLMGRTLISGEHLCIKEIVILAFQNIYFPLYAYSFFYQYAARSAWVCNLVNFDLPPCLDLFQLTI